jgi:hypothetical protein
MSTNVHRRFKTRADALEVIRRSPKDVTVADVQMLLQAALEVERFTIPPYLTALYSINEGTNIESTALIRSVVVEEMLHISLDCNVLNAIGGAPDLRVWPSDADYPNPLPYSAGTFTVNISRFDPPTLATFCEIEHPGTGAEGIGYHELSEFYRFIMAALVELDQKTPGGVFVGDPSRQVWPSHYYSAGGMLLPVTDLASALAALQLVIDEGEGADGGTSADDERFNQAYEPAHYYRFLGIQAGQFYVRGDRPGAPTGKTFSVDWAEVAQTIPNLTLAELAGFPAIQQKAMAFNDAWAALLSALDAAFNGQPDTLQASVAKMFTLKYQAEALMRLRLGDNGLFAGPVWNLSETKR